MDLVAILTGLFSLVGVIITNNGSNKRLESKFETLQATTDCKIEELTREVRKHNNFAERTPILEEKVNNLAIRIEKCEKRD